MKRYVRHLIAGIALIVIPLNALGDDVSWGNTSSSNAVEHGGNVPWNADTEREITLDEILAWTVAHTDYKAPKTAPELYFQPRAFFVAQACSSHEPCSAKGIYRDGENQIVLHEDYRDLTTVDARAMLVHELIHLLQDQSGLWTSDGCQSWVAREREAYLLQRRYLIAKGGFPPYALRLPSISEADCDPPPLDHVTANQSAVSTKATRHRELRK